MIVVDTNVIVALAADLGTPLVTSDRAVLDAFPRIARSPERFIAT